MGVERTVVVPSPSCPSEFCPKACNDPSFLRMREWDWPSKAGLMKRERISGSITQFPNKRNPGKEWDFSVRQLILGFGLARGFTRDKY